MSMEHMVEEEWVSTTEGAEITGYNAKHLQKLARDNWRLPESERLIKVRKRSRGYDIWLPDLFEYRDVYGIGPFNRDKKDT